MEAPKMQIHPDSLKELVVGNKIFRSSMDFRLIDSDLEICYKELKETEANRNDSIQKLREMLLNNGNIEYRTDDAYLLRYLRYRKFDIKEAYKKLQKYYTFRMKCPDLFYLPTTMDEVLKSNFVDLMPYTTEQGVVVFIIKLGKLDLDEMPFRDAMLLFNVVSDVFCSNPHSQINGFIDIFDLTDLTFRHVAYFSHPRNIKLWSMVMQELYPWRIKGLVFWNCNMVLYASLISLRFFTTKKVADRIIIPSDLKDLHKHVSPHILPKEYGGTLEESEYRGLFNRCLLDNVRYLEYEHSFFGATA